MSLKLHGYLATPRVQKVVIAADFAGLDLPLVDFQPRTATEEQVKEYKKKNPNNKVPLLETPEGPIFESNAILRYIARVAKQGKLYGSNKFEEAQVDQYLDWAATVFEPAVFATLGATLGFAPYNKEANTQAGEKLTKVLQVLEGLLANKEYLVGSSITVADIAILNGLAFYFRLGTDETIRKTIPNITKYVTTVGGQEQFTKVTGRVILGAAVFPAYTGPLPQPEEAKKAEPKQKAAPQPKKEAAPKKKKDEEEEDDEPKEKKVANALDSLPPSSFNLFDFKTLIVNAPDKKVATDTFLQQFDPAGYSVWRMEYEKAEGEGNVLFLTSNLMNGFLQRLETFRKYSFGVVGVYGQEPDLQIRGCWVWRGNEIPFEIKDHPSGEWYKFRKLDVVNNAEDKQVLYDYWTKLNEDEDVVEGLMARDIKYFK